jgi:ribonucleoside-diphosphate reductase alpha chain
MTGLKSSYEEFIALSRYARWKPEENRRESWEETVDRLCTFWEKRFPEFSEIIRKEIQPEIYNTSVMPSMRSLMTAGPALERDEVAGFNCSYVAVDNPRVFDEIMYILMCGTGLGFSAERQYITQLPVISESFYKTDTTIVVGDSKIGWAKAFRELLSLLYQGQIPKWDLSKVRKAGEKLKTFGGRASGPKPLNDLFLFVTEVFSKAAGRKLNSIEVHDIVCKIADIVVVGGVRRSALISLSNLSDPRMRDAKSGQWWVDNPQRALANNSVCYTEKPDIGIFMEEWKALYDSKSGERGIFNREAAELLQPDRRKEFNYKDYGCNPCSEIILRSKQFCNLTEVVIRSTDTFEDLKRKVRIATILGTFQSSLTNFRYLSSQWKKNTEEEALLGVSLTGIMDHVVMAGKTTFYDPISLLDADRYEGFPTLPLGNILRELKELSIATNKEWAKKLGVNQATAITCVKPSGTVSQLVDSSSGIHPRYSEYYIRTVRSDNKDPLAQMMIDQGFPVEEDVMKPGNGLVFSFPIKAPKGSVMRNDVSAIDQLNLWKTYQLNWCEHKPSITVYVKEDEWLKVGSWVYDNFNIVSGISFLPHSEHTYQQAPYQEISKDEYEEWLLRMPKVNWSALGDYEKEDTTTSTKEYACSGNSCEIL